MEDFICHAKGPGSEEPLKGLFKKGSTMIRLCDADITWTAILIIKGDQIGVSFNCPAYTEGLN